MENEGSGVESGQEKVGRKEGERRGGGDIINIAQMAFLRSSPESLE